MAYEVLARKWRPRKFDEVIGQEHVTRTLRNAIEAGRVAHAYMFVGPRGVGKTSLARIFAKCLNCEQGIGADPCDTCSHCREIMAGSSLDVLEIDGASNNSVDQVRELRETIQFAPANSRFKIVYIDEVHMLSNSAFNALLKTLEEPPAHVKFLFATTEADKVLPTIISRCQRFDLRRIPVARIVETLRNVTKQEKVEAEEDALLAIARGAEGGMRDALSALDQIIAFHGENVREEDVLSVFGLLSRHELETLASGVLAGDVPTVLQAVDRFDKNGKDLRRLVAELLGHVRNVLVVGYTGSDSGCLDVTDAQRVELRRQAGLVSPGRLIRIAETLVDLDGKLRYALSGRTLVETALIRCARAATTATLEEILRGIQALRSEAREGPAPASADAPPETTPAGGESARVENPGGPAPDGALSGQDPGPTRGAGERGRDKQAAVSDPVVREALEIFKGRVVDVT